MNTKEAWALVGGRVDALRRSAVYCFAVLLNPCSDPIERFSVALGDMAFLVRADVEKEVASDSQRLDHIV